MKKFVGYVNGKTFKDEDQFNEAAKAAIKDNDGTLSISSYYTYLADDEEEKKEEPKKIDEEKIVSTEEYYLGDRKPDVVNNDSYEYTITDELKKRLADASNIDEIKKNLDYRIARINECMSNRKYKINELEDNIEKLQNELYTKVDELKNEEAIKKYYDTLCETVDAAIKDRGGVEEKKEEEVPSHNETLREFLGIDDGTSFYGFLKKTGLLK